MECAPQATRIGFRVTQPTLVAFEVERNIPREALWRMHAVSLMHIEDLTSITGGLERRGDFAALGGM